MGQFTFILKVWGTWTLYNGSIDFYFEGMGNLDSPALMQQWFQLVQQKNAMVRYESELMIL